MKFLAKLWRAEIAGLAALLICAVLMGVLGFVESYLWSLEGKMLLIAPLDAARLVFSYAGIIGVVAVVFYGAPAYALLRHRLRASWPAVVVIGAAPGVAVLPFDSYIGVWLIVGGVVVACLTHFFSARFLFDDAAL